VIARRDYGATVFSRIFILFLITPLFSLMFGGVFAMIGHRDHGLAARPAVALVTEAGTSRALIDAHARLAQRLGNDALPDLVQEDSTAEPAHLLHGARYVGVLGGPLAHPRFTLSSRAPAGTLDDVSLILDTARADAALGGKLPPPVTIGTERIAAPVSFSEDDRVDVANGAQTAVFFLLVLLAGMSLSTFIEEKSNKVIEVLAAAVPVDAIFIGKLAAMLAISLTGVAIWGATALAAVLIFFPHAFAHVAPPAVGWPIFCVLTAIYFMVNYLLLGAVFLGLGSQAASPREVQSMAMPVTMLQLVLWGLASSGTAHPGGWLALAAAIFPWSSPLAMLGHAAIEPALWPHLVALLWQAAWLVLALRLAAGMFRSAVLKSGGSRRGWWRRRAASQ
jgi:ABC-2 type transport system permease protein